MCAALAKSKTRRVKLQAARFIWTDDEELFNLEPLGGTGAGAAMILIRHLQNNTIQHGNTAFMPTIMVAAVVVLFLIFYFAFRRATRDSFPIICCDEIASILDWYGQYQCKGPA